jgi:hypothetical protein
MRLPVLLLLIALASCSSYPDYRDLPEGLKQAEAERLVSRWEEVAELTPIGNQKAFDFYVTKARQNVYLMVGEPGNYSSYYYVKVDYESDADSNYYPFIKFSEFGEFVIN